MQKNMTSFKIYFSDNNIRRISSDVERPTYEQFTELLMGLYPNDYHPELYVRWRDEDGDLIIASSEAEWTEMLNAIHERPIKLYVTEGMTPYFKDGPPAEPQYFYAENEEPEEKEKPELLERWECFFCILLKIVKTKKFGAQVIAELVQGRKDFARQYSQVAQGGGAN